MDNSLGFSGSSSLWIFGYGSLCWRPGIEYKRVVNGFVKGYARRFWQGNITHRGTASKPGRVATLIEDETSHVWGCAYEVTGETALPYLTNRECKLGGYMTKFVQFYPKDGNANHITKPFTAMIYIATPKNDLWLGEAPLTEIAQQIVEASGECGHNVEYLIRLADFMKRSIPDAEDDHLFALDVLVRTWIRDRALSLRSFLGSDRGLRNFDYDSANGPNNNNNNNADQELHDVGVAVRVDSFQFTARVPDKNLRCLNI